MVPHALAEYSSLGECLSVKCYEAVDAGICRKRNTGIFSYKSQYGACGVIDNARVIQLVTVAKGSEQARSQLHGALLLGNVAVLQQLHYSTGYRCLMSGMARIELQDFNVNFMLS